MIFYDTRAGVECRIVVNDAPAIAALQAMIDTQGKPAHPQAIARALTACLRAGEKDGFAFAWRANEEVARSRGVSEDALRAARQRLEQTFFRQ
jgi:DNA-binding phage protein